eukprot:m51a1_g6760 hypothetical protein (148) ;mRNA; r:93937-94628
MSAATSSSVECTPEIGSALATPSSQLLANPSDDDVSQIVFAESPRAVVLPFKKESGPPRVRTTLDATIAEESYHTYPPAAPTFVSISAPLCQKPQPKYCQITGLPAPYTDPETGLRYANKYIFPYLRHIPQDKRPGQAQVGLLSPIL